jgi:hypothetical protein
VPSTPDSRTNEISPPSEPPTQDLGPRTQDSSSSPHPTSAIPHPTSTKSQLPLCASAPLRETLSEADP